MTIRAIDSAGDLAQLAALLRPDAPPGLLKALSFSGNYVAGVFDERGRMVGGGAGMAGIVAGLESLMLAATAVPDPAAALKLRKHARSWAKRQGFDQLAFTFDPLSLAEFETVTAGLRATVTGYLDADRMIAAWPVKETRSAAPADVTSEGLRKRGASIALEDRNGEPVEGKLEGPTLLFRIPSKVPNGSVLRWRQAVADTLLRALDEGYRVTRLTRDGYLALVL